MTGPLTAFALASSLMLGAGCAQQASAPAEGPQDLVREVRAALAQDDVTRAEALVAAHREQHGLTPEGLLGLSWLGRGHLAQGNLDLAESFALQTHDLALLEARSRDLDDEPQLPLALGASIETLAQVTAARGARSEAVAYLARARDTYANTSLHIRIQKNIHLLSLEGQPMLPLAGSEMLGEPLPAPERLQGRVVLLFFWAHWCSDCKRQGPVLERLLDRYGLDGLTVVASTQRYGYVAGGEDAGSEEEAQYIGDVWTTSYAGLHAAGVPTAIDAANHLRYGVSSTPTLVLVDRGGIIRMYNPGQMSEEAIDARIRSLLYGT
jgi:thiol-disulfide isomerase/thioredoxin